MAVEGMRGQGRIRSAQAHQTDTRARCWVVLMAAIRDPDKSSATGSGERDIEAVDA